MRFILTVATAALVGGIAGFLVSTSTTRVRAQEPPGLVVAKEFVLLDEKDRPAARLMYAGGETLLRFYNEDATVALEIGAGRKYPDRHIQFFGKDKSPLARLSATPYGDTTLNLTNQSGTIHAALGALFSDSPPDGPVRDWGLDFQGSSPFPVFSIHARLSKDLLPTNATIQLKRQSGDDWEIH